MRTPRGIVIGSRARWCLGTGAVAGLTLLSVLALGKGGSGTTYSATQTEPGDFTSGAYAASTSASDESSSSAWFEGYVEQMCDPPTHAQCDDDPAYASTWCGRREVSKARRLEPTRCDAECRTVTAADCDDETWLNTVCGHIELARAALQDSCGFDPACPMDPNDPERPLDPNDPQCQWECPDTASHPSVCVREKRQSGGDSQLTEGSAYPGLEKKMVIVPSGPPRGSSSSGPLDNGYWDWDPVKREVGVLDESGATMFSQGSGRHYWSKGINEAVAIRRDGALAQALFESMRERWDNNDEQWAAGEHAVESCREYIHEKYYDYSVFEDRARARGDSPRDRYDVAYSGFSETGAIGTQAIGDDFLQRKDGMLNDDQVLFPQELQQKNPLFEVWVHENPTTRAEDYDRWGGYPGSDFYHKVRYPLGDGEWAELEIGRPFSPGAVYIVDEALYEVLRQGRFNPGNKFTETWAWHQARQDEIAAAGYIDEELYALDKLKERLAFLLHERTLAQNDWADAMEDLLGMDGPPPEMQEEGFHFDPGIYEAGNDPFSRFFVAQEAAAADWSASLGIAAATGSSTVADVASAFRYSTGGMQVRSGPGPGGTMSPGGAFTMSAGAIAASTQTAVSSQGNDPDYDYNHPARRAARAARRCVQFDDRIEVLLLDAMNRGCLNLAGADPCDWSPAYFAQRVEDPFMRAREIEYEHCLEYTAARPGQFNDLITTPEDRFFVNIIMPDTGEPYGYSQVPGCDCSARRFNQGTDEVECYLKCTDKFRDDLVSALNEALAGGGVLVDPETREVSIVEQTGDSDAFGSDVFNLNYDYAASWRLSNLPPPDYGQDFCSTLKPRLHGHFSAGARVLVADVSLLSASGDVGLDGQDPRPQAHLEVLGEQLIDVGPKPDPDPTEFNIIFEETEQRQDELFSIGATFVVVVVPITISGGIAGRVGARATVAAGSGGSSGQSCNDGGMLISGTFEPFVGVDAFASASINAVIVEAGVKITVTIAEVGFPFTIDIRFVGTPVEGGVDLEMIASTSLDVVFRFLGGRFSAFVEVCFIFCEEYEETLFKWSPITLKKRLLGTTFTIPLFPLLEYADAQG